MADCNILLAKIICAVFVFFVAMSILALIVYMIESKFKK